ncbi:hypothetical protein FHG64_16000 [Antarcticibacterium flavum]|uniref:Uncharacterized protein n=1 Tax=Antarcticibacterium flavum TaxID=2058175 RepID=A0A5B7X808_9FLAO|nr:MULTISPECIES: hypothetical protein [Antarcticibacterium]MCM4161866.1 hypothetical protein [Antarcticibacterium sp. W02-3]QCY70771.1 hypothetical protein FHG64_16000 [Antarcticibacterium flavum]
MSSKFNIPNGIMYNAYFILWKDANYVEEFYKKRLESYLYNYSHEKSTKDDHLKDGKLYFSGVTKDGIEITENDFIHYEITRLNLIPEHLLDFDGKKRVDFYRQFLQKKLFSILLGNTKPLPQPEIDLKGKFIDETWFKIGLTFATGQAQRLYEEYKDKRGHFTKVATKLGFKSTDRPYFSQTIHNSTVDNKNLYSDPDKLEKIYTYCQVRNITVCSDFLSQLSSK